MLVICNGAIKSGSTWLYNILAKLAVFSPPDEKYLTLRNPKHPCIKPEMLKAFIETEDCQANNYLSKNHLDQAKYRDLLMGCSNAFVFDIERDPKDVVVSSYYHDRLRNGYSGSFSDYYWHFGREVAARLASYHELWRNAGPRSYVASYERLHKEFDAETRRISQVIGVSLNADELNEIKEATTLRSLRGKYKEEPRFEGEKFFRKGMIGDWESHLDEKMLADIQRIERLGIQRFDRVRIRHRIASLFGRGNLYES